MAESSRLQRSLSESKVNGWLVEHILEVRGGQEKVGTKGTAAAPFQTLLRTMHAASMRPLFTDSFTSLVCMFSYLCTD